MKRGKLRNARIQNAWGGWRQSNERTPFPQVGADGTDRGGTTRLASEASRPSLAHVDLVRCTVPSQTKNTSPFEIDFEKHLVAIFEIVFRRECIHAGC